MKKPKIATILEGGGHVDRAEKDGQSWVWVPERMNIGENSYPSSQGQKEIEWEIRSQILEGTKPTSRPLCWSGAREIEENGVWTESPFRVKEDQSYCCL